MAASTSRPTETLTLEYPILVDGVKVDSIAIRRPTVRDMLTFERSKDIESVKVVKLLATLAEIAPSDIEQMDQADFLAAMDIFKGFQSTPEES